MTTSRAFLKRHMATGALLAVLAAAGCSAEGKLDINDSASPSDSVASPTASPSPTSDPASSSAPPSPDSGESEASEEDSGTSEESGANSGDYESCNDGECEVSFTDSVEFPLGGSDGQWTVEAAIEDEFVRVNLTKPSGMGGGGGLLYHPGCTVIINPDGGGSLSCAEEGEELREPDAGGIAVHLLELNGDDVVVQAVMG